MEKLELPIEQLSINNVTNPSETFLGDDILSAILVKFPVKTLIRFTCVAKSWNSLIRSPTFIAAHIKFHKKLPRDHYLLHMPSVTSPFITFTKESIERGFRSNTRFRIHKVVGSCESLVCVVNNDKRVCLWNPLLQTFKFIPHSPSAGAKFLSHIVFGLGYSVKNDDHIIVKISYTDKVSSSHKVEIYSLKSNAWKSINLSVPAIAGETTGVYINGCINWVATPFSWVVNYIYPMRPDSKSIMWFDIDNELFGEKILSVPGSIPRYLEESEWPYGLKDANGIPKGFREYFNNGLSSLWKGKVLARENSWAKLRLNGVEAREATTFDGAILLHSSRDNLFGFLGFEFLTPWNEKDSRMSQRFHIVCVSQSLLLFDH